MRDTQPLCWEHVRIGLMCQVAMYVTPLRRTRANGRSCCSLVDARPSGKPLSAGVIGEDSLSLRQVADRPRRFSRRIFATCAVARRTRKPRPALDDAGGLTLNRRRQATTMTFGELITRSQR